MTAPAAPSFAERLALATNRDAPEAALIQLARDPDIDVRLALAANRATPAAARHILSRDADPMVRAMLAGRVAQLVARGVVLSQAEGPAQAANRLQTILTRLVVDTDVLVRAAIADAVRDLPEAPKSLILRLARDIEMPVAEPVIRLSPLLSDADLLVLVADPPAQATLAAVARRPAISAEVSDAIVATGNDEAVAALLGNGTAAIREDTLDRLVADAAHRVSWRAPLVVRPRLPGSVAMALAEYIAGDLLSRLAGRADLDADVTRKLRMRVAERLGEAPQDGETPAEAAARAAMLHRARVLHGEAIERAARRGEADFVASALSLLTGVQARVIAGIRERRDARGVAGLCWRAGLSAACADAVHALLLPGAPLRAGYAPQEMRWETAAGASR